MAKKACPLCKGERWTGRGSNRLPCQGCNPVGAGDAVVGFGKRVAAQWKAFKKKTADTVTGTSRTRLPDRTRTTHMGTETVQLTPGMRSMLPANQARRKPGRVNQQARGQTTAKRPVRCQTCGGFYGRLKCGRPRAHHDPSRGNIPCPGGGALKNTPRKKR